MASTSATYYYTYMFCADWGAFPDILFDASFNQSLQSVAVCRSVMKAAWDCTTTTTRRGGMDDLLYASMRLSSDFGPTVLFLGQRWAQSTVRTCRLVPSPEKKEDLLHHDDDVQ